MIVAGAWVHSGNAIGAWPWPGDANSGCQRVLGRYLSVGPQRLDGVEPGRVLRSGTLRVKSASSSQMVMVMPLSAGRELYGNYSRKCPNLSVDFRPLNGDRMRGFGALAHQQNTAGNRLCSVLFCSEAHDIGFLCVCATADFENLKDRDLWQKRRREAVGAGYQGSLGDAAMSVSGGLSAVNSDYAFERGKGAYSVFGDNVKTRKAQTGRVVGLSHFGVMGLLGFKRSGCHWTASSWAEPSPTESVASLWDCGRVGGPLGSKPPHHRVAASLR
jgi:hypothetical protein